MRNDVKEPVGIRKIQRAQCILAGFALVVLAGCAGAVREQHVTRIPGREFHYTSAGGPRPSDPGANEIPAIPGGLPSAHEEIWVIAQTRSISNPSGAPVPQPTSGALCVQVEDELVPMPLRHTDVKAAIAGYISTVNVVQQFHNPYEHKIEAVYVFPLPENAAVSDFIMTIGERRIRGIIRERAEAERIYGEAKRQGYTASLLTQERPNIFSQSVANIEPGRAIDVSIQYFHTLAYDDGWYEFVFPMVVGPRFNPAGITNGIGAVDRTKHSQSNQATEVQYLGRNERSGHDIALQVDVGASVAIEEVSCVTHRTLSSRHSPEHVTVTLSRDDTIPNKDFVLRYRVAGERIKSNLLTHRDHRGGFFTLMLYPPSELTALARQPLELVFVLDCSGSMSGAPIEQAKAAIRQALERLQPEDSFQIINFSEQSSALGPRPLSATPANIGKGLGYLSELNGDGPTMMLEGIKAALDFPHDPARLRFVCFLTDGFIGNEADILLAVEKRLEASRIFSFGVGSAPNRYLLDGMARIGRGAVAYLGLKDDAGQVMDTFFDRISHPALTDVKVDWGGLKVSDVYPKRAPDLFVGRPIVFTGRCEGDVGAIRVEGTAAGRPVSLSFPAGNSAAGSNVPALPQVWARMKISELMKGAWATEGKGLAEAIKAVALDFNLVSPQTSFVAVDASRRTGGKPAVTTPVAVPVPEGVNADKTIEP
jgi:Ca-activated chloride channel family protein